ncbi:MAG: radical SAM protein [bacterium]
MISGTEKQKIILCKISPDFSDAGDNALPCTLALGLHYIRAYCLQNPAINNSFDIKIKTFRGQEKTKKIINSLEKEKPQLVGFSSYDVEYLKTIEVAEAVKKRLPETKIVVGGPQFYSAEEELRRHWFIDVAVPFEGELPFEDYLSSIIEGRAPETVRGIAFRKGGDVRYTGLLTEQVDLKKIPPIYDDELLDTVSGAIIYQTSRGCAHRCAFCSSAYDKYREFPLDQVKDDLDRMLSKPKIKRIIFADLDLAHNAERFKEILDFLIEHNKRQVLVDGFWSSLPKIEPYIGLMREAGFIREFGISMQSGALKPLKIARRQWLTVEHLRKVAPTIVKHFPDTRVEFILGLPGESPESFRESHYAVFECGIRKFLVVDLMVSPGSEFHERRKELGLEYRDDVSYRIKSTPDFSEEELQRAREFSKNFQILAWILQPSDLELYKKWGMNIIDIADRIKTLKDYCTDATEMGISFRQVREEAIDVVTELLESECGMARGKVKIINEYLHVKYKIYKFERDIKEFYKRQKIEGQLPLIPQFVKMKVSLETLGFLNIKQSDAEIGRDKKAAIYAIYNPKSDTAVPITSKLIKLVKSR